jgi:putative membrane protein
MIKDFIDITHARKQLSSGELQAIKKELVQTHITWITTFRYQIRVDKLWETHLKKNKQNAAFKEKHYFIFQNKTAIE